MHQRINRKHILFLPILIHMNTNIVSRSNTPRKRVLAHDSHPLRNLTNKPQQLFLTIPTFSPLNLFSQNITIILILHLINNNLLTMTNHLNIFNRNKQRIYYVFITV